MSRRWALAAGLSLVATAAVAGFLVRRALAPPHVPPQAAAPLAVKRLPNLTLPDVGGQPRSLSEWKGHPLLINFWATWCGPCRREIPFLKSLRQEHASQGLEVVGVALDFRDAVAAYARSNGIDYPLLIADQDGMVTQAFGLRAVLPSTVFVDRDGRIVAVKVGELHAKTTERLLKTLLEAP